MIFCWDDGNRAHIGLHDVTPIEAEEVVARSRSPFPRAVGDGKFMTWGQTSRGRYLQVIFVFKHPDEVTYDSLTLPDWDTVHRNRLTRITRVIHAMDLPNDKKRALRKYRK